MSLALVFLVIIIAGMSFVVGGVFFRKDPPAPTPASPKPFGLKAFEGHGLATASDDVLKAVVATISFLGHPFTVVEEAKDEVYRAYARDAQSRQQIADNLEEITALQEHNKALEANALEARARASQLSGIIEQVKSESGS